MKEYLILGLASITIALWFWTIHDITKSNFKKPIMRTLSLIFVLIIPTLGSEGYLILRKKLINNEKRRFRPQFSNHN